MHQVSFDTYDGWPKTTEDNRVGRPRTNWLKINMQRAWEYTNHMEKKGIPWVVDKFDPRKQEHRDKLWQQAKNRIFPFCCTASQSREGLSELI